MYAVKFDDPIAELTEGELAARAILLNSALAREYDLTGEQNFTKRVLALAERGLEAPIVLRD
jgi:hypothetical protein